MVRAAGVASNALEPGWVAGKRGLDKATSTGEQQVQAGPEKRQKLAGTQT